MKSLEQIKRDHDSIFNALSNQGTQAERDTGVVEAAFHFAGAIHDITDHVRALVVYITKARNDAREEGRMESIDSMGAAVEAAIGGKGFPPRDGDEFALTRDAQGDLHLGPVDSDA